MDSPSHPPSSNATGFQWRSLNRLAGQWLPLALLLFGIAYGLAVRAWMDGGQVADNRHGQVELPALPPTVGIQTEYTLQPLSRLLRDQGNARWTATPDGYTGIGYLDQPATFRFTLSNPSGQPVRKLLVVSAPFLDRIRSAMVLPDGAAERLPVMGDTFPFRYRHIDLPQWIWPVTLPPGDTRFLFEVENSGPTLLPISVHKPENLLGHTAFTLAWKAFIAGLLGFALLFNISIVVMLRRPGLAWLSVFMVSVIHSQLSMDGFGLWLLWSDWPLINNLLGVSLPLALIALCQFTPHFLSVSQRARWMLHGFSCAAFVMLITTPLGLPFPGQGSLLVLATFTSVALLALITRQLNHHVYARYLGLAMVVIIAGAGASSLRTVGWVPVNDLTDSAFFLGAAMASLILTVGVGRLLLEERKRRLSADLRARQEQQRRSRIEKDYDRLLKTHRVTGKPNRAILEECLETLHKDQQPYTLCIVRLQRFHEIEQALGYRTAEALLKTYLRRLNSFLKRTFSARLIMINGYALASIDTVNHAFAFYRSDDPGDDQPPLEDTADWLGENFRDGRFAFSWSPSVGVAHAPDHGHDAAGILSSAGFASLNGDQLLCVYDPAIAEWQYRQQILMLDVEDALANEQMWLEYQPKVRVRDGQVSSVEALIRWRHDEFGLIPPGHWVPLAEQVGVIHPVTLWVIRRACRDYSELVKRHGADLAIAVNISAKDLDHPRFDQEVLAIIREYRMQPRHLILELTETAMMANPDAAQAMIHKLSQVGFRIALDDFGTGHSSLGTLATFDLDELKIDRSFLRDILEHPTRQRIFRAALELGEALDLDVVVEGVETEAVATWLQQFPGLHGQGYYWGRPEPLTAGQ